MQAYKIALYLFLFNYALCFFGSTQFFGSAYITPPTVEEGVYSYGVNDSAFGGLSNETFVPGHDPALLNITQDFIDYQPNDLTNIGLLGAIALAINALADKYRAPALLPRGTRHPHDPESHDHRGLLVHLRVGRPAVRAGRRRQDH